jgi:hypothetical protein
MTLALGLLAILGGTDLLISGITKRPLGRLVFGYWDAPGSTTAAAPPTGANAASGGVYAPPGPVGPVGGNTAPAGPVGPVGG